ncbi:MAG: hypothetical protein K8R36_11710, partial [Planctomycetales bacterium]|nr:hypothetical protein [Planctomycetales bacterium]
MRGILSRRQLLLSGMLGAGSLAIGCGTILHPERRGQRAGTLDPGVVLLDGLGLLLFFVPGVIAFAVDFSTGAIYLPEGAEPRISADNKRRTFQTVSVDLHHLSRPEIARTVSMHTGKSVRLEEGEYHTAKLKNL